MPTKKTNDATPEPIIGPGKDPGHKLTVQKSLPLFSLWRSNMTLPEFKILDTYLSRINSHDPERRTVLFTKGEMETLLGVSKINKKDLVARLRGLERYVELKAEDDEIHRVPLFDEIRGKLDAGGQWTMQLTCSSAAMKYIFNIDKIGYLRYKLRCITSLTSRYTYVLFTYLESNRFRKSWEIDVDELRMILNCDQDELYKEYKRFNERILKRCQTELFEKSECRFSYEPIKKGRRVVKIRFTLETLSDKIDPQLGQPEEAEQQSIFLRAQHPYSEPRYEQLAAACKYEFDEPAMDAISTALNDKLMNDLDYFWSSSTEREAKKFDFLQLCYKKLERQAVSSKIPNRFKYLLSIIDHE